MPSVEIPTKDTVAESYKPTDKERETITFLTTRIQELKEFRKKKLPAIDRSIEDIWAEVDREYTPHTLQLDNRTRFESDDDTGLRSRKVSVGKNDWQSDMASPDLYVKVQTALAILIDQNPEAVFMPSSKKYESNTLLAYGNWKNSWEVSGAKQQVKNFVFNMSRYGTGIMRTYPKIIEQTKKVRTEYYPDQPEKDVYTEKRLVKFNDLCRESLNPKQVWVSEMTRPGDYTSVDDWYFEKDFSYSKFCKEFKDFKAYKCVGRNSKVTPDGETTPEDKTEDTVTVGYYENQVDDIYAIFVPSQSILLYQSPLVNDDGMLSLTYAPWTLRDDCIPWGIGLWEIIKNDTVMYDRVKNMTMDQLCLMIYKMFLYKGTDILGENGELVVTPGKGLQVNDPTAVKFLEVPGPGQESWKGMQFLQEERDRNSGVNAQLTGDFGGKTLGQDVQAKEQALERMKGPLDYLLDALQQEAYITLSWQKQILSTPEVLEYTSPELLVASLTEFGLTPEEIEQYMAEVDNPNPNSELLFNEEPGEDGTQRTFANVYKETSLNLEQDDGGELIESDNTRFYRFGLDLPTKRLEWKGIVRIKPQSVLAPSKDLMKRQKLELFNLTSPYIQMMLAQPQFIPIMLPSLKQIVKVHDEEVKDWIPEKELMALAEAAKQPQEKPQEDPKLSVSIKFETLIPEVQTTILEKYMGITVEEPLFVDETGAGKPTVKIKDAEQSVTRPSEEAVKDFAPMASIGSADAAKTTAGALSGMQQSAAEY